MICTGKFFLGFVPAGLSYDFTGRPFYVLYLQVVPKIYTGRFFLGFIPAEPS
jgi:hypothetical protein